MSREWRQPEIGDNRSLSSNWCDRRSTSTRDIADQWSLRRSSTPVRTEKSRRHCDYGLPVSQWKIKKFSGGEEELPRFLAMVREFALAEEASKVDVSIIEYIYSREMLLISSMG